MSKRSYSDSDSDISDEEDPEVVKKKLLEATRKSLLEADRKLELRSAARTSSDSNTSVTTTTDSAADSSNSTPPPARHNKLSLSCPCIDCKRKKSKNNDQLPPSNVPTAAASRTVSKKTASSSESNATTAASRTVAPPSGRNVAVKDSDRDYEPPKKKTASTASGRPAATSTPNNVPTAAASRTVAPPSGRNVAVKDSDSDYEPPKKKTASTASGRPAATSTPKNVPTAAASRTVAPPSGRNVANDSDLGSEWDTDGEATIAQNEANAKKQSRIGKKSTSSKSKASGKPVATSTPNNVPTAAASRTVAPPSEPNATAASQQIETFHATTRTTTKDITFLGHIITKEETKFVCPFVDAKGKKCGIECTTYSALESHYHQYVHKRPKGELQRPLDSAPNNWRRVQNNNNRFDMSTVKVKVGTLLVGGNSVIAERRLGCTTATIPARSSKRSSSFVPRGQEHSMAAELYELLERQAKELSRVAILFSHLVLFRVYRLINTADESVVNAAFKADIDFNVILLTLKSFIRSTKNSRKTDAADGRTLYSIDDTDFDDMCRQHNVVKSFEQWSQNSWNHIADTFRVNFMNNIMVHLYRRLRNWMYFRLRNGMKKKDVSGKANRKRTADAVYHTMKFMFGAEECSKPELVQRSLIKELQGICKFPEFNDGGRSYFCRLYKTADDDSDSKPTKPKRPKKSTKTKTKTNIGDRLVWTQMVPGFVRLQKWIHTMNLDRQNEMEAAGLLKKKKKRKRKRKRKCGKNEPTTCASVRKPSAQRKCGKKRNRTQMDDGEEIVRAKLKNFVVVPQHGFGMKHFAIDSKSLFDLVKNLSAFKDNNGHRIFKQKEFVELSEDAEDANGKTSNPFWHYIFNIRKLETSCRKFGGRITTNSSDVSVQLCRIKETSKLLNREAVFDLANRKRKSSESSDRESDAEPEPESDCKATRIEHDRKRITTLMSTVSNLEDVTVSGVDLGMRNVAATVIRTWNDSNEPTIVHESNVLHKSKDYHYKAGFYKRRIKRRILHGAFDEKYATDQPSSSKSPDYMAYLNSRLKFFNEGTAVYQQRPIVNLTFEKYRQTQQEMTQMAKEIVGDVDVHANGSNQQRSNNRKRHIVFVGDCSTPANSPIKGHLRSPGDTPICRYLRQRPHTTVIRMDEYKSTKNCSRCYQELESVESSKDRLKICQNLCKPAEDSTPATVVSTKANKKFVRRAMETVRLQHPKPTQIQRKERVERKREDRWSASDKIRIMEKRRLSSRIHRPDVERAGPFIINRDINACRNIIYLGLCSFGQHIHPTQQFTKNTAFFRTSVQNGRII